MEENVKKIFGIKIKTLIYLVLGLVLIGFLAFYGKEGFEYIKGKEVQYKQTIEDLNKSVLVLESELIDAENEIYNLNEDEKIKQNEFLHEKNRRIRAEKNLDRINLLVFDREFLDSIAKYIEYR